MGDGKDNGLGGCRAPERRGPLCFMHVPKSGGMSFHAALEAALPQGALAPRRMDISTFCGFREFDLLQPAARSLIAVDDEEIGSLRRCRVVSGHFSLTALLRITAAPAIGTVLREPRARVISLYTYWRTPKLFDQLLPYRVQDFALRPFASFLAEPQAAPAVDNQVCRMLLYGDRRIPCDDFIAPSDIDAIASDAIVRLDSLGFVGALELGSDTWDGLGRLFGLKLKPRSLNVTGETYRPLAAPPGERLLTADALDLLEQRNAADRIVFDHALARAGIRGRKRLRLAESSFADQLVRLRDMLGHSTATPAGRPSHRRPPDRSSA